MVCTNTSVKICVTTGALQHTYLLLSYVCVRHMYTRVAAGDDGVYSLVDEVAAAGQRQIPVRVRLSHNPASQDAIKALATVCKTTKQRR